ncbi:MAG TPA: histidine phosphatase family protein [Trebonia sp.]
MPPASTPTTSARTLWLARHGESTWNTRGLTQGHNDQAELTARGKRQAAEIAKRFAGLPVRAIYASDLRRAQQTAAPLAVAAGVPVVLDARLRERCLGVLEGTPAAGNGPSVTGLDLEAGLLADPDTRPDGGESVRDLYRRAAAFCDFLFSLGGSDPPHTPPAHGGASRPPVPPAPGGQAPRTADGYTAGVRDLHPPAPGGQVPRTADGYTAGLPDPHTPAGEGDIVVVAHGGTLRVLRAYLSGVPVEEMDWPPLANATVLEFPEFGTLTREGER